MLVSNAVFGGMIDLADVVRLTVETMNSGSSRMIKL